MEMRTAHNLSISNSKITVPANRTVRYIASVAAFILLVSAMALLLSALFQTPGSVVERKRAIAQREADSIDIMIAGNSHAYCTFDPAVIEKCTAGRVFNAGLPDVKIDILYYSLLEMLKKQDPDTIILEGFTFGRSDSTYQGYIADMDALTPGYNKLKACLEIYPGKLEAARMFISLYRSHSNWKKPSVIKANLKYLLGYEEADEVFNGFYPLKSRMSDETIQKYREAEDIKFAPVIDSYTTEYFQRIVKLCRERGIRLIVVMAPFNDIYLGKVAYTDFSEKLAALCEREEVELIDFNLLYKEIGLDYGDFEDAFHHAQHMNRWGAEKVSVYMGKYLADGE